MTRYLLAREVAERISIELNIPLSDVVDVLVKIPVGDVISKSEAIETLSDIKRQIHEKAIYPNNAGIKPYISVREVDAIIQDKLKHMEERRE